MRVFLEREDIGNLIIVEGVKQETYILNEASMAHGL